MRSVTFYRISAIPDAGLAWLKIANYPVPDAPDDGAAVEIAERRFQAEMQLASWEEVADVSVVHTS